MSNVHTKILQFDAYLSVANGQLQKQPSPDKRLKAVIKIFFYSWFHERDSFRVLSINKYPTVHR